MFGDDVTNITVLFSLFNIVDAYLTNCTTSGSSVLFYSVYVKKAVSEVLRQLNKVSNQNNSFR